MKKRDIEVIEINGIIEPPRPHRSRFYDYEIRHRGRFAWVKLDETGDGHWRWVLQGGLLDMHAESPTQYGTREQALDAAIDHFRKHRGWKSG